MKYENAIKLRNLIQKDFKKNEPNLIVYLSKLNKEFDNDSDWIVVISDKGDINGRIYK